MDNKTQKYLLNIVKRNYEEIADDFNESRKKYIWPEILKLTANIKNKDKVIDVGCGNGRLLEALKNKQVEYLGVDNSARLINIAKSRYANIRFTTCDILELSKIPQINFDYVFCIAVLQNIPGQKLRIIALKQLKNKISQDGRIIISVWNMWSNKWKKKKFKRLIIKFALLKLIKKNNMDWGDLLFDWHSQGVKRGSKRYYHAFRKRELKKIIKKAGLKIEKIYKDEYNYYAILKKP